MFITLTDKTSPNRAAVVDADTVPAILAGWLQADGLASESSPTVRSLARAINAGDWAAVHALADELAVGISIDAEHAAQDDDDDMWGPITDGSDVEAVDCTELLVAAELELAAEVEADMADGWGFLTTSFGQAS